MGLDQPNLPGLPGWPRDHDTPAPSVPTAHDDTHVMPPPWADLPNLSDPRGQLVPARSAAAQPPAVVSSQMPTVVEPALHREAPTLTAQIRRVQPPDVARQAVSELGVLARELDELPHLLADAGLASSHGQLYRATVTEYLEICHYAWEAVAQEQLEQAGAAPDYRATAVEVARSITRLKQECEKANVGALARRGRWLPPLWRRRVALIHRGLVAWQAVLAPVPDPLRMGRALFALQGYVGLANAGGVELAMLDLLLSATLTLVGMATLGAMFSLVGALLAGVSTDVPTLAAIVLSGVATWTLVLLIGVRSALPLGLLMGASIFVPARAACLGWQGSPAIAWSLRVWWLLVGALAALAVPVAIALGGVVLSTKAFPVSADALDATRIVGRLLYETLVLPAITCVAVVLLLALPFAVVAQVRFVREAAGNTRWVPAARRYALPAALVLVIFVSGVVETLTSAAATALGWQHMGLVSASWSIVQGTLTLRGVALIVAAALPYLLLLDLPYRIGIGRWRAHRLTDLASRRAELESQVRRLTTQPATDDLLRAMQYDLVLLQFYRGQEAEARAAHAAPFRIEGRVLALVLAVAGGLTLDGTSSLVLHLLIAPPH